MDTRRSELLNRLSLDRQADDLPAGSRRSGLWWIAVPVVVCTLLGWGIIQARGGSDAGVSNDATALETRNAENAQGPQPIRPVSRPHPDRADAALQATGYVIARQAATVSARTTAAIQAVFVNEGSCVEAGDALAQLDDRVKRAQYELAESERIAAGSRVAEVSAEMEAARLQLERVTTMAERDMASQAQLDEARTAVDHLQARLATARQTVKTAARQADVHRLELEDYVIRAPFTGVVTSRSAQPGEIVSPMSAGGGFTRTGIATLVDMQSLEVEVDVNEAYISRVRPEQPVRIVLNAYPDRNYDGRVIAVIPTADRNKATIRVRIAILEPDARVMPEMGVRVDFLGA